MYIQTAVLALLSLLLIVPAHSVELPTTQYSRLPLVVKPDISPNGERIAFRIISTLNYLYCRF